VASLDYRKIQKHTLGTAAEKVERILTLAPYFLIWALFYDIILISFLYARIDIAA